MGGVEPSNRRKGVRHLVVGKHEQDRRGPLTDSLIAPDGAFERSDAQSKFELAVQLAEQDRLAEAEEALAQADEQGHPQAATRLGLLLESRGDVARATAAYRRADERGDADGAF